MKKILLIFILVLSGCVTFNRENISPRKTALEFENRSFNNPRLKNFIEKSLKTKLTKWPLTNWNLSHLIFAAYFYNPKLDIALAKWEEAKGKMKTAGQIPNPKLNLLPEFVSTASAGLSPWIAGVGLEELIQTAGKRKSKIAETGFLTEAARQNIASIGWQIRSSVRNSFLNLYFNLKSEKINREQLQIQKKILKLFEERFKTGEASRIDVTQEKIKLNKIHLELLNTKLLINRFQSRLANAIGIPLSVVKKTKLSFTGIGNLPGKKLIQFKNLRAKALTERSDILSALAEYAASQMNLKYEIAKQFPNISIGPGYKWDQGSYKWSLGFSFSLPVFNRNQGPIAVAQAMRKEKAAAFLALQFKVINKIDQTYASYNNKLQELKVADFLLSNQKRQLEFAKHSVELGEANSITLQNNLIRYYALSIKRLKSFFDVQSSLGKLEDALQSPIYSKTALPEINNILRIK